GRDALDAVLGGGVVVLVGVQLGEAYPLAVLVAQFLEYGGHHLARATPRRPKIHDDGDWTIQNDLLESTVINMHRLCHCYLSPFITPCAGQRRPIPYSIRYPVLCGRGGTYTNRRADGPRWTARGLGSERRRRPQPRGRQWSRGRRAPRRWRTAWAVG